MGRTRLTQEAREGAGLSGKVGASMQLGASWILGTRLPCYSNTCTARVREREVPGGSVVTLLCVQGGGGSRTGTKGLQNQGSQSPGQGLSTNPHADARGRELSCPLPPPPCLPLPLHSKNLTYLGFR